MENAFAQRVVLLEKLFMNSFRKIIAGSVLVASSMMLALAAHAFYPSEMDCTNQNVYTPSGQLLGNFIPGADSPGLPSTGLVVSVHVPQEVDYTHQNVYTPSGQLLGNFIVNG